MAMFISFSFTPEVPCFCFEINIPDETIKNWLHKIINAGNSFKKHAHIERELTELKKAPHCASQVLSCFPLLRGVSFCFPCCCFTIKPKRDSFKRNVKFPIQPESSPELATVSLGMRHVCRRATPTYIKM